jgi:hypothetical protein
MLTIKHVEYTGYEHVITAREVSFYPKGDGSYGLVDVGPNDERVQSTCPTVVAYGIPGPDEGAKVGGCVRYSQGNVFVMNEAGKTVSAYYLGGSSNAEESRQ